MRVARFYQNSFSSSFSSSPILFAKCLANCLRQASRQSSSPSVSSRRLGNPLCQVRIAVCTAGPHPSGSDRNVHRWTSAARVRAPSAAPDCSRQGPSAVCTAGPHRSVHRWTSSARVRWQCAPLDLNRQGPIAVYTAGLQLPGSYCSVHDLNQQKVCLNMPDRMPEHMPNRMADRMSEYTSD